MKKKIEESLRHILPVNGYLFGIVVVDQNSQDITRNRAVWVVESPESYEIEFNAEGWVADAMREYITRQLRSDGYITSAGTLTIPKSGEAKHGTTTSEKSQHSSIQDRIDDWNG